MPTCSLDVCSVTWLLAYSYFITSSSSATNAFNLPPPVRDVHRSPSGGTVPPGPTWRLRSGLQACTFG